MKDQKDRKTVAETINTNSNHSLKSFLGLWCSLFVLSLFINFTASAQHLGFYGKDDLRRQEIREQLYKTKKELGITGPAEALNRLSSLSDSIDIKDLNQNKLPADAPLTWSVGECKYTVKKSEPFSFTVEYYADQERRRSDARGSRLIEFSSEELKSVTYSQPGDALYDFQKAIREDKCTKESIGVFDWTVEAEQMKLELYSAVGGLEAFFR
jgi:hypothetical protein